MSSPQNPLHREPGAASDKPLLTSHQAAHAVLFTNELLCDIVAQFPVQDMVVVTGVCRFWRTALSGNERIQIAMFLKPAEIREAMVQDYLAYCLTRPIPLDRCFVIGDVHPSLARICGSITVGEDHLFKRKSKPFPEFTHGSGNWRDMFISQPPCKRVCATIDGLKGGPYHHLENSAGIKLGELYDHIHTNFSSEVVENSGLTTLGEFAATKDVQIWEAFTVKCQVRDSVVIHPGDAPSRPVINPYSGLEGDYSRPEDFPYSEDESDSDGTFYDDLADSPPDDHDSSDNDGEELQDGEPTEQDRKTFKKAQR